MAYHSKTTSCTCKIVFKNFKMTIANVKTGAETPKTSWLYGVHASALDDWSDNRRADMKNERKALVQRMNTEYY